MALDLLHIFFILAFRKSSKKRGPPLALTDTFKALSDARRREVLEMLRSGRKSAGEIAERFDVSAATVSHHLALLKKAGLVTVTREGTFLYYELNTGALTEAYRWLRRVGGAR